MNESRVVTLDNLLDRLESVLGRDSLLFHRFEAGLRFDDEHSLTDAIGSLRLYPDAKRKLIEDTVMGWLLGNREREDCGEDRGSKPSREIKPRH
jgi:hypothetical protein